MKFLLFFTFFINSAFAQQQDCPVKEELHGIPKHLLCKQFIDLQEKFELSDGRSISVEKRIKTIDTLHSFYRSFPNFFYYLLNKKNPLPTLDSKKFSGLISGDPHIENFGAFAFKENGETISKLSMNDFDDGGKGNYSSDLLRYLGSLDIYINEEDPGLKERNYKDLIEGYIQTLKDNGKFTPSESTAKIKIKSIKDSKDPLEDVDYENGKFIDDSLPKCNTNPEKEKIQYVFEQSEKGHSIDCYRRVKDTGGSAGLARQYYLTKKKKVVEFKTLPNTPSSEIMSSTLSPEQYASQTQDILKLSLGEKFATKHYKNAPYKGQNFLMRTHSEGFKKLRPNKRKGSGFKLDKEQRWSIVGDQVKILGTLHAKTLTKENKKKYIQELEKLKEIDWRNSINEVKRQFSDYYNACKN